MDTTKPPLSLEALLASHRQTLTSLYTSLSPSPGPVLASHANALQVAVVAILDSQRKQAEEEVAVVERKVTEAWKRVGDWRAALGEQDGKGRGEGPLTVLVEEVEGVLSGMRSRMEERGKLIVQIQKKLLVLTEVLGKDFLSLELENVESGWEGLDLRLERMSALEREVMRCEAELAHRRGLVNGHINEIFALRNELGIHQNSALPTSATHASEGANAPVADPFDEAILSHLGVGESREHKEMLPTTENLARVEAKRKWLEDEKDHRNGIIQATYDKLYPLWSLLGVSEQEMEDFVNRFMGSTSDVVNAYQSELQRMLTLKRSNLSAFIMREREALTALWDALFLSDGQRHATFPPFTISVAPTRMWNAAHGVEEEVVNDNVSEELLVAHERERERVEAEVEGSRPVLERLARYFGVVEELRELEASAADPTRLTKSTRGDPGRLLREEKARKRVAKEKPKLESELRQFIPQWEHENGRPFLVNGRRFLDDLDQVLAEAAEKDTKKRTRTVPTKPPAPAGPSTTTRSTAPLRAQHTGASTASSHHPQALKRQHTGISTVSSSSSSHTKAPAAKRQVPSHTGGSSKAPLGEIGNTRARGQSVSAGSTIGGGGGGGMKIPSGWGAPSQYGGGYQQVAPQPTGSVGGGGFRPRPSAQGVTSGLWGSRA